MTPLAELIGNSPGMTAVRDKVTRLLQQLGEGRRQPPILIQGETGTGKTVLARAMHRASARRDGPFVSLNCSAIPETLLESELFGHERGAFTGADKARPGYFQQAHRGTLFLDEIALMSDKLQAKVLTAIEDKDVRRVGSTRSELVDVWVVAASNADLATLTRDRRFREDLYQRLAVVTLWLPPLRDRGGDILLLAEHFLDHACRTYGLASRTLDAGARAALVAYHWPGNIRELANVMERAVLFADDPVISSTTLGLPAARADEPRTDRMGLKDELINVERERLLETLREEDWNLSRAAKRLGIPRNTLRHRLKKLGLLDELRESKGADAADVSRSRSAAEEPMPTETRREPRRLALLRAELVPTSPDRALPAGRSIDLAIDKVQVFGGRIEERSPTGVLASFGLEPVEDAPERAAHTAVALEKAAERARAEGEAVAVNLAIHVGRFEVGFGSGPAVIDLDGMREARRVLDALLGADRDMIVVSEAAVALLERRFELVPLPVAHGSGPRAYRLVGRAQPAESGGRRMAAFVGRRHNLELLESHLAAAMRGQGQVIGIVGDAGIGKSRLVAEFRERLAGRDVTYLEGACASYASAIP